MEDLTGRPQEMQPVPLDALIDRVINEIASVLPHLSWSWTIFM